MRSLWRILADHALAEVNWAHVGHVGWVMTKPKLEGDVRSITARGGLMTISKQMWSDTNGGWLNARRWPSFSEMLVQSLTFPMSHEKIEYKL